MPEYNFRSTVSRHDVDFTPVSIKGNAVLADWELEKYPWKIVYAVKNHDDPRDHDRNPVISPIRAINNLGQRGEAPPDPDGNQSGGQQVKGSDSFIVHGSDGHSLPTSNRSMVRRKGTNARHYLQRLARRTFHEACRMGWTSRTICPRLTHCRVCRPNIDSRRSGGIIRLGCDKHGVCSSVGSRKTCLLQQ